MATAFSSTEFIIFTSIATSLCKMYPVEFVDIQCLDTICVSSHGSGVNIGIGAFGG